MTKLQQVYRELRRHVSREEARYAAIKLVQLWEKAARSDAPFHLTPHPQPGMAPACNSEGQVT